MGWSYPEISLEDLMKLIKSFIDMLILASGYQSTGRLAHWDSHNIKTSFRWALFLETVVKGLTSSVDYEESVKELNTALFELTSNPHFPQGLAHFSCITLGGAMDLLLAHLIHTLPLRDSHLKAIITATVETDFSKLQKIDSDSLDVYLEKLMRISSESLRLSESRNFLEESKISSQDSVPSGKHVNWHDGDFSVSAIQQLGRRQLAVSRASAVGAGLENLWKTIGASMHDEFRNTSNSEQIKHSARLIAEDLPVEPVVWNHWKFRSLSYMLDKRTIRLVSGASLICSTPEVQWCQMFERLNISAEGDNLCEITELLLLGHIADNWSAKIEHLMSVSYESHTITRLCHEVFNLPWRKSQNMFLKEVFMNPKEKSVVHYLEVLLSSQVDQLWELFPVLAAIAIPSWSQLFRSYLCELEGQFRENSSATRRCSCIADSLEHREYILKRWGRESCQNVKRIWVPLLSFRILFTKMGTNQVSMLKLTDSRLSEHRPPLASVRNDTHGWMPYDGISALFMHITITKSIVLEARTMKMSNIMNWRKIQIFKWARTLVRLGSAANLVSSVQRKTRCGSCAARLLLLRLRSRWKQLISWQSNTIRYNYDAQSYSKNFDHGSPDDNSSPLAAGTSL